MKYDLQEEPRGEESAALVIRLLGDANRILDVGCSTGRLGKALAARGAEVWGIELDAEAAKVALATGAFKDVVVGDIETMDLAGAFPEGDFDAVVFADVLEHLVDAEKVLESTRSILRETGCVIASVPNVTHASLRLSLLGGRWRYTEVGLLDRTHLRFFDVTSLEELFSASGFSIEAWERVLLLPRETEVELPRFLPPRIEEWVMAQPESTTYQFVVRARPGEAPSVAPPSDVIKRAELGMVEREVESLEAELRLLRTQLQTLEQSLAWRFALRFRQLRTRIGPPGSHRDRFLKLILAFFSAWSRYGLLSTLLLGRRKYGWAARSRLTRLVSKRVAKPLGFVIPSDPVELPRQVKVADTPVDIVVPVRNALEDVRRCLHSLVRHTTSPFKLMVVDDGSDEQTKQWLADFCADGGHKLIRHEETIGYVGSANDGLSHGTSDWAVLLNSDTILTPEWLDRLLACAMNNDLTAMVGPLSNTASWQSIPEFEFEGDWHPNPLPTGYTPETMAGEVAKDSGQLYPEMPFLNGFCLLIRRNLLDETGGLDQATFGQGYGEETDLALKVRAKGKKIFLCDDSYVYHAQSRSFSHETRKKLSERGMVKLISRYGQAMIDEGVDYCRNDPVLQGIRARAGVMTQRHELLEMGRSLFSGKRVLFVLPIHAPGGGAHVIFTEARAMAKMGVTVELFNLRGYRDRFTAAFPDFDHPVHYGSPSSLSSLTGSFDAVVAATSDSVAWISDTKDSITGYYIQDFEPYFFPEKGEAYERARASFTLSDRIISFTKTSWNRDEVREQTGVEPLLIGVSVNLDLYRPRPPMIPRWPERPLVVSAMIRPASWHRQAKLTLEVLKEVSRKRKNLHVVIFGMDQMDLGFRSLPRDSSWQVAGVLSDRELARLLNESDIFVDLSRWQAMGLTALGSMACGGAVLAPKAGGADSFVDDGGNGLLVDTTSSESCVSKLEYLIDNHRLRESLRRRAVFDTCRFFPETAAFNILAGLFGQEDLIRLVR